MLISTYLHHNYVQEQSLSAVVTCVANMIPQVNFFFVFSDYMLLTSILDIYVWSYENMQDRYKT